MQAWENFLNDQEAILGRPIVDRWLRSLKIVHFDSGNLYLEAKDSFQVLWFEEHIRPQLKSKLLNNNFRPIKVHLTSGPSTISAKLKKDKGKPLSSFRYTFDTLNPEATFENFIPGQNNEIAYRFFCELAGYPIVCCKEQQSTQQTITPASFNPIYLWGESGCGKTHLLMAITHRLQKRGLNALYARVETFTEHVIAAIRNSEMQSFRTAYRHVDVLLIDDVHLFARKDATQEEFFHTFNTLHSAGKQIILSAKCSPALLQDIEPRLVSRFEWGINIHFEKLNAHDLKQVLVKRCEALRFPLSEEVLNFLIKTFSSSKSLHRALEALIFRCHVETDARFKRTPQLLDPSKVAQMLSDLMALEQQKLLNAEKIISVVAKICDIRYEDILGKAQNQEYSLPRQIAMYLCRQELKLPFQHIGRIFERDHSTVMTSIKQIEKKINTLDQKTLTLLTEIRASFESVST